MWLNLQIENRRAARTLPKALGAMFPQRHASARRITSRAEFLPPRLREKEEPNDDDETRVISMLAIHAYYSPQNNSTPYFTHFIILTLLYLNIIQLFHNFKQLVFLQRLVHYIF